MNERELQEQVENIPLNRTQIKSGTASTNGM